MKTELKNGYLNPTPSFFDHSTSVILGNFNKTKKIVSGIMLTIFFMLQNSVSVFADKIPEIGTDGDNNVTLNGFGDDNQSMAESFARVLNQYKGVINAVTVGAILTLVLIAIVYGVKLSASGAQAQDRAKAQKGLMFTLIGAGIVGAAWTLIALFINILL